VTPLSLEKYLSSVKRFHEAVSELAAKLEEINNARDQALKASDELRKELDATDNQMQELTMTVRQQIAAEFTKKVA
jgi:methyl-accepting chemotaxis protein